MLGLLNPIALHEPTPSFSAQGLSRTFAAAVSAAHVAGQQLVIAEVPVPEPEAPTSPDREEESAPDVPVERKEVFYSLPRAGTSEEVESAREEVPRNTKRSEDKRSAHDPWKIQLSILNTTTRTFGPGERGWVGRTVRAERVAERWCRFVTINNLERDKGNHSSHEVSRVLMTVKQGEKIGKDEKVQKGMKMETGPSEKHAEAQRGDKRDSDIGAGVNTQEEGLPLTWSPSPTR
jgi:hypothetical protein